MIQRFEAEGETPAKLEENLHRALEAWAGHNPGYCPMTPFIWSKVEQDGGQFRGSLEVRFLDARPILKVMGYL